MTPDSRIRIVDVIHLSSSADTLLRDRVLAMRERGFDNRIACAPGPHVRSLRAAGVPVHTVTMPRTLDPVRLLSSLAQLVVLFRRERVDVVHTHCSIPGVVGRLAARIAGVPVIVHTVHGFHFHAGMPAWQRKLFVAIERCCGWFTSMLLTQNRTDLECALAHDIGRPGRRRCIGNGIQIPRFDPSRREPASAPLVMTCVARLEPVKNHSQLLEAAAILRRRGARFQLRLVGDGPLRARYEAQARSLGLADVVQFLGYRDDIPELLSRTQIAVLTSVKEGIPRALLEAMAMEIPVVATRVKGSNEVVRDGEDGRLVPLGDVNALVEALAALIEDAGLRERLGRNARQRVLDEFDERAIVRRLGDLYDGELARGDLARARTGSPAPASAASASEGPCAAPNTAAGAATSAAAATRDLAHDVAPDVARNALIRLGAQLASAAINLAAMVLLGRALGASRYGEYTYLYAFIPLVASVCDLGAGLMVTREMAWRPHDTRRLLGDGLTIKVVVLVFLLLCVTLAVPGQSGAAGTALLLLILLAAAIDPSQDPASWVLRARGRADLEAGLLVASQLAWLAALAACVAWRADAAGLLAATLVAYTLRIVLGTGAVVRRWGAPEFRLEPARLRSLVAQGLPYGVAMTFIVLYGRVGVMMLKGLAGSDDVAHFQVAYLLSQPFGFIASALALAAFPVLSRDGRADPAAALRRVGALARILLGVSIPLAVVLALYADRIVGVLFAGRDYAPAAVALRVIAPVLPLVFLNLLARYVLAAFAAQAWYLGAVLAGCAVNVALCVWLIPRQGITGACLAYGVAEFAVFVVCQYALRRVPLAGPFAAGGSPWPGSDVGDGPAAEGSLAVPAGDRGDAANGNADVANDRAPAALGWTAGAHDRTDAARARTPAEHAHAPALPLVAALGAVVSGTGAMLAFASDPLRMHRLAAIGHTELALPRPLGPSSGHPAEAAGDKLTVLRCALSDRSEWARLEEIAALPCVESLLALPDLHGKPHMEVPSSLAITTCGALVPEFTSVAVNDGMGVMVTELEAGDLTHELVTRVFARINSHAAANALDANRYSLSPSDLVLALREGGRAGVRRYGLDPAVLERMQWSGRFPIGVGPGMLDSLVPRVMQGSRIVRSEMGLNFGGNHFLEAQVVERVLDPAAAQSWGLAEGRVVFMYHLGPGPFSGTLLHHFTRREKLPPTRAAALFVSKLAFHFLQRAESGPASEKWRVHFRRNRWTVLREASESALLFQQALALAMNFGFAYRLATVAAIRDALDEVLGVRARLLCDVQHNSIAPERHDGRGVWVARHNACPLSPSRPAIVAGAHDVASYLACGGTSAPPDLHSYDHGAGHLIERWRRRHPQTRAGDNCLRIRMGRGRRGGIRSRELVPLASPAPIVQLMECLEGHGILRPAVRLRPLATLKN